MRYTTKLLFAAATLAIASPALADTVIVNSVSAPPSATTFGTLPDENRNGGTAIVGLCGSFFSGVR